VQLSVTGRHIEISDAMKQYAQEKAARLPRFYDRVQSIEVILDRESLKYRAEIIIQADHGNRFVGHVDAQECHEAVDLVIEKLERQLVKHKEKHRNRKHPEDSAGL
jgi:putative sigma-54 modulation protein